MKNIFRIYKRDMKSILTNWVAVIVMAGLIILPSLYAWFNIRASWDPYGRTSGISVAVVTKDKGTDIKGHHVIIGDKVVEELKKNKLIGWNFTDEKDAQSGVERGKYYASIVIPENFSEKIGSAVGDNPEKAEFVYTVNEKRNAISPKITDKGASSLQQQVNKSFIETVSKVLFNVSNEVGVELEKDKPEISQVVDLIVKVGDSIPEVNKKVDDFYNGLMSFQDFSKKIQSDVTLFNEMVQKSNDISQKGQEYLIKSKEGFGKLNSLITEDLNMINQSAGTAEGAIGAAIDYVSTSNNPEKAKESLRSLKNKYNNMITSIDNIESVLKPLNNRYNDAKISELIDHLETTKKDLQREINNINDLIDSIDKGQIVSVDSLKSIKNKANEFKLDMNNTTDNYETVVSVNVNRAVDDTYNKINDALKILQSSSKELPTVSELLEKIYSGTSNKLEDVKKLKVRLNEVEVSLKESTEKVKKLSDEKKLDELIDTMKKDASKEVEFISGPVKVKENRLYHLPNYGSAMSPFYTTLSLWVGALILVSLIAVNTHEGGNIQNLKTHEIYFGRYLTFITIAVFQGLTVVLGDLFLLKVYAANKVGLILLSVYISIIFTTIVYTMVSVFGNVGKALCVIMLVLQVAASGGTFPIEMTPHFYQDLNPFLPFTYAIGAMREVVAGPIWDIFFKDIATLSIYFFIAMVLALTLKKVLNEKNEKFVEKFKEAGLAGEE